MESDRFIVTGSGRSGTRYVAFLLASLGMNVGHERVWNGEHPREASWDDALEGEVGWEAAAHLDDFDGPVIHVVRYPLRVMNSRVLTGWYQTKHTDNPYRDELVAFSDEVVGWSEGETNIERAILHWTRWCAMIDQHTDHRFKVESLNTPEMLDELVVATGHPVRQDYWVDFALRAVPQNTNQHTTKQAVTWEAVQEHAAPQYVESLVRLAEEYGYDVESP